MNGSGQMAYDKHFAFSLLMTKVIWPSYLYSLDTFFPDGFASQFWMQMYFYIPSSTPFPKPIRNPEMNYLEPGRSSWVKNL